MTLTLGQKAAMIHKDMCDDNANGYSWSPRWGEDGLGIKSLLIDGKKYYYDRGSFDCSSSTITAWATVFKGTEYEGVLDDAITTHNMREVFTKSGLFEWKPMSFLAEPGDLYLSEANHVAMCQTQYPDILSEFSWGDNGAYGNKVGDQSGKEASVHDYYDYPWDGILHYNGKADEASKKPVKKKQLFGIDVSSNQPEDICKSVDYDFAIVKMSGNPQNYAWDFVNPYAKQQATDAYKSTKCVGLYHHTWGKTATAEAKLFVDNVKKIGFLGKAMLLIDYEAQALNLGRSWVSKLAKEVEKLAGYKPVIYASGSVIVNQDLFSLGYPIWCANYSIGYKPIYGYNTSACQIYPGCEKSILWQYTSKGFLDGCPSPLDCNVFFGDEAAWQTYCGKKLPVDGVFGPDTISEFRKQLGLAAGTTRDKAFWNRLQKKLGVKQYGRNTQATARALRKKLGLKTTARWKTVVKALQKALNAGEIARW